MIKFKPGDIYEDCAYHPVICSKADDDSIEGVSMLDGTSPRSCSLSHCGVRKLTTKEAEERIAVWKAEGERGLMRLNGWTDKAISKFMKTWRSE